MQDISACGSQHLINVAIGVSVDNAVNRRKIWYSHHLMAAGATIRPVRFCELPANCVAIRIEAFPYTRGEMLSTQLSTPGELW